MKRLEECLAGFGSRIALVTQQGDITYAALNDLAGDWADLLDTLGAERVAYRLDNGPAWLALDLALLATGRVAIPVPHFFADAQLRHAVEHSGADILVTDSALPAGLQTVPTHRPGVYRISSAVPAALPPDTAKLTFTSGTTGRPKGVCLSAATLIATAQGVQTALEPVGVTHHMSVLPLSLLLENVAGVYANLLNGGTTTLLGLETIGLSGSSGIDLGTFVAAQNRVQPESLILVPQLLLALTAAAEFGMPIPGRYRFVAVGGGKVSTSLLERARRVGIPAYEGYGLTECGSVVALNVPGADRPGSVGRPLPHARIAIAGGRLRVLEPVMLGYTGECGTAPVQIDTGDLGEMDADGYLHVSGRAGSHYISAFGRNISPEWIEGELAADISIGTAVVFGDAQPANVALLVARTGFDANSVEGAVRQCNARLPDYARVSAWRLVDADEFRQRGCLTDNGRPRRAEVGRLYQRELEEMYSELKEYS